MENRSLIAYEHYRDASIRLEYFMTGLIGALCAYIAQQMHPQKLAISPYTLELISLLILSFSLFLSFKRLEQIILIYRLGHHILDYSEKKGSLVSGLKLDSTSIINVLTGDILTRDEAMRQISNFSQQIVACEKEIHKKNKYTKLFYNWRNRLIYIGFIILILSKVLSAYI